MWIVAEWWPTNSDCTWLVSASTSQFDVLVAIKGFGGWIVLNAFWMQEVSWRHSATWSRKCDCLFCVLLAGLLAKSIKLCSPGLASQFCRLPNIFMSRGMCIMSWNFWSFHPPLASCQGTNPFTYLSLYRTAVSMALQPSTVAMSNGAPCLYHVWKLNSISNTYNWLFTSNLPKSLSLSSLHNK